MATPRPQRKRLDEGLLRSGVAIMTGGQDMFGRPLVIFPTTTPDMLTRRYTTAHLVLLLKYYVTVTNSEVVSRGGFAVVSNLATYTKEGLQSVIDTLDKLQVEICGSVGILYAVLPKSKESQRALKKLLGLKPSKKHPKVPTFEAVLLDSVQDFQKHIQRGQLTSDLGGTMTYNHLVWTQLTQDMEDLEESVTSAIERVPGAIDKVTMLSEYDMPEDLEDGSLLLMQIRTRYNDIMRELNLEHLIDECNSFREKMCSPEKHEGYRDITQTITFPEAKGRVADLRTKLLEAREQIKLLWQQAESRILLSTKFKKYKMKAEKVTEWIQQVGLPAVNQDSEIADCLSKAEILKNHFETGFLTVAKNVLWLGEKILNKLKSVLHELKTQTRQSKQPTKQERPSVEPVLTFSRQFQATVEYFQRAVEKKHQVYTNVHAFFLNAMRAPNEDRETSLSIYRQLQKITKWYRRTLKFLPVQLLLPQSKLIGTRPPPSASHYISGAWRAAVEDYVLHTPLPSSENLTTMKNVIPVIDNISIRNQARLLISRVTTIRSFLVTPEQISYRDLQDILLWKEQVKQGQDEIYLSMTTSTLDLQGLVDASTESSASGHIMSARQQLTTENGGGGQVLSETDSTSTAENCPKRAPKLRLAGANGNEHFDGGHVGSPATRNQHVHPKQHSRTKPSSGNHQPHPHQYGAVRPSHSEQASQLPPGVPRLDLSGLNGPSQVHKSYTDRGAVIRRQQSFGIYGDIDDSRKKQSRMKTSKSTHNLGSIQNSGRLNAELERYVSLSGTDTPKSSELPKTLKHIDIGALKSNVPQEAAPLRSTPFHYGGDERNERPHSYESLVDSGITHMQSSTEGSGVSISTNGLSPTGVNAPSALNPNSSAKDWTGGDRRMAAVIENDEDPPESANARGGSASTKGSTLSHAHSLPNLAYERDGRLSLVQDNVNIIVNSRLSAEEKLQLMTTMCECDDNNVQGSQLGLDDLPYAAYLNAESLDVSGVSERSHRLTRPGSTEGALLSDEIERYCHDPGYGHPPARDAFPTVTKGELAGVPQADADTRQGRPRTPKLNGAKLARAKSPHVNQQRQRQEFSFSSPEVSSAQKRDPMMTSSTPMDGAAVLAPEVGQRNMVSSLGGGGGGGYGIDIEAWMRNQEEGSEVLQPELDGLDPAEDGMAEYVQKWKTAQEDRAAEEHHLQVARDTLGELLVHEERLNQEAVERSLARTEQMLQDHEDHIRQEKTTKEESAQDDDDDDDDGDQDDDNDNYDDDDAESTLSSGTCTVESQCNPAADHLNGAAQVPQVAQREEEEEEEQEEEVLEEKKTETGDVYSGRSAGCPREGEDVAVLVAAGCTSAVPATPRDLCDSSLSGESGVFTLTKGSDATSRASTPRRSSESHNGRSLGSASSILFDSVEVPLESSLRSSFSDVFASTMPTPSKSGVVRQLDFRDMLKSINREVPEKQEGLFQAVHEENDVAQSGTDCQVKQGENINGSHELAEAQEFGDSLRYAKALNKDIERKCTQSPASSKLRLDKEVPVEGMVDYNVLEGSESCKIMSENCQQEHTSTLMGSPVMTNDRSETVDSVVRNGTDNRVSSADSTPVNSPRYKGGLSKWGVMDVSVIREEPNISQAGTLPQLVPEERTSPSPSAYSNSSWVDTNDIRSNRPRLADTSDVPPANVKISDGNSKHPQQDLASNQNVSVSAGDLRAGHSALVSNQRSEDKEHADMKVKVENGGGAAWINAPSLSSYSMELAHLKTPIIIDNGSGMCKCGFADQDLPSTVFPAIVGRAKYEDVSSGRTEDTYVGSAAQNMRGVLKLRYPLEHGIVTDWDDMELIWHHAFLDQLRVSPADHPVLVTEAPLNPRRNRERMMEVLFESFQVPAAYVAVQAVLALYASGRTTGMVIDSGDGVSHFVPIYEGYALSHAIKRLDLAGRDLTHYMAKLLAEQGVSLNTSAELELARDIKENHCYVADDPEAEAKRASTSSQLEEFYTFPDGHVISLNSERFRCPEVLFDPSLIGREHGGLPDVMLESLGKVELDLRQDLISNIVLSGGTTMIPGMRDRLQKEISSLAPPGLASSVQVTSPEDRYFSVWQGGAVLASLPTFADCWISREEYLDYGGSIVHVKCF